MELEALDCDSLLIRGARIVDPYRKVDAIGDLAVVDGIIVDDPSPHARVLDASGLIVCPGLMDIHVHLRDPGQTHKENIATGSRAAAAGGFTFVACMPNTDPPVDNVTVIQSIVARAREARLCEVGPIAAITQRRRGERLTDFDALRRAGAVAFSDDGTGVEDDDVMAAAFDTARRTGTVLIQHCEYRDLSAGGVMHAGETSRRLGLPGLDPRSEEAMIERDLEICARIGGRYHVAHISTARAVELVRHAKQKGLPVTAEVSPHHLLLTDAACANADPNTKMHPPLRSAADVEACRAGLVDGTIDCIATDHAPHTVDEKSVGFLQAPPGIVGLETAIALARMAMIETKRNNWNDLIRWFTAGPAGVLGLPRHGLGAGGPIDATLLDPEKPWVIDPNDFASKGRNTPFAGWEVIGRAEGTLRRNRFLLRPHLVPRP